MMRICDEDGAMMMMIMTINNVMTHYRKELDSMHTDCPAITTSLRLSRFCLKTPNNNNNNNNNNNTSLRSLNAFYSPFIEKP